MKRTAWENMLTHEDTDPLGDRVFAYFHRDMGEGFRHCGDAMCPCGPLRVTIPDDGLSRAVFRKLDTMSHQMVN